MKTSLVMILILFICFTCKKESTSEPITNPTEISGQYLGQTPPGNNPVKFAPSNSYLANGGWWWRSSPTFSPDGNEMYFTKYIRSSEVHEIWYTKIINGQWSAPQKAPFSTTNYDSDAKFLQSKDTLYFYSRRPGKFIFKVTRISTGWSEPAALNIPLPQNSGIVTSFHISKNKNIYFAMLQGSGYNWPTADIYISKFVNGQYIQPEKLASPLSLENIGEVVGYVDPDERFMIFESNKGGGFGMSDMYISYRGADEKWNTPINLSAKINTGNEDCCPLITPDGRYFFFTSLKQGDNGYTPYWVDASSIEVLKNN
ncbi:MAG: hypothetical protein WC055_01295 [Melioribacteraceae bacterium]